MVGLSQPKSGFFADKDVFFPFPGVHFGFVSFAFTGRAGLFICYEDF